MDSRTANDQERIDALSSVDWGKYNGVLGQCFLIPKSIARLLVLPGVNIYVENAPETVENARLAADLKEECVAALIRRFPDQVPIVNVTTEQQCIGLIDKAVGWGVTFPVSFSVEQLRAQDYLLTSVPVSENWNSGGAAAMAAPSQGEAAPVVSVAALEG